MKKNIAIAIVGFVLFAAGSPAVAAITTYNCAAMTDTRLDQRAGGPSRVR